MPKAVKKVKPFSVDDMQQRLDSRNLNSSNNDYLYVETGRYKPWSESTVRAIVRRGYRADWKCPGVYYVYPKVA